MKTPSRFVFTGARTSQISFPLGGIGSGCIGLAGNGQLVDWEILNHPNKGSLNGFTHLAVKAEHKGRVLDARILHADLPPPYSGTAGGAYAGFGFGPSRDTMAGLPHFRRTTFRGEFPIARLDFHEPDFPGQVALTAFNPFIPLNDKDSSLPAAFLEVTVRNPSRRALDYTLALSVRNPFAPDGQRHAFMRRDAGAMIQCSQPRLGADDPAGGDLTIATDAPEVSHQEYWFRGGWFDNLGVYWHDLSAPGRLINRTYPAASGKGYDHATLAAHVHVAPGKTGRCRFVIAWNSPTCCNYWNPEKNPDGTPAPVRTWRNYYATLFPDSAATATYALSHWDRLAEGTTRFKDALFRSTLPAEVLDAVSANISILKTPTVLRLEDGSFYGWEGCGCTGGCCEGSCTHVWNYAYALPYLFPKLERSMRDLDYRYNLQPDGGMPFRLQLPLGRPRSTFRPCADGQFGGVIKVYREWKTCGNTDWLRTLWPSVRQSIDYAWAPTNDNRWDPDQTGVLWGRQHHTLDMELFGPNAWLTGFYLAALKAGAEMAAHLGEPDTAARYRRLFERGQAWVETHLFNGSYYIQRIDLGDHTLPEQFACADPYWNAEHGEIKYQIGEGCGIDQVLAQWHANLVGLGDIFDRRHTLRALRSIFRHNFKTSMRSYANVCRLYALNDESGAVMFDWPKGTRQPVVPIPYATETMHGFEYQAAGHMIQMGLVREGLALVRAVRDRYDGERRNPWNEIECGSNYARSMASYALLHAFSGFSVDLVKGELGFNPVPAARRPFRCFWSVDPAWGEVHIAARRVELTVLYGDLSLRTLHLPFLGKRPIRTATVDGRPVAAVNEQGRVRFPEGLTLRAGESLRLSLR